MATTTIIPDFLATLGRTGNPVRDGLINNEQQQQLIINQQNDIIINHNINNNNGDINIWALPSDCTALTHAFLAAFSVIIVSELGDKTFIITAIMAMKNSRLPVFLASAFALLIMTILSVVMGVAVTVIPEVYTHYASIVLFICFGLKMLKEAYDLDETSEESEFDEVKRSLGIEEEEKKIDDDNNFEISQKSIKDVDIKISSNLNLIDDKSLPIESLKKEENSINDDNNKQEEKRNFVKEFFKTLHFAPLFIKVFTMIFVAEWGDRSQISTVILAAREDVTGVFVGSFIGHVLCTGLAVIGGKFVAEMISVKTMTLIGGFIFLLFAAVEIISGP